MLFLQRKYADAVAELQKTLAVDPEDLEAHYNLMLCYRGLNNDELANREEKLYLRFKADESSRAITGPFKLTHPDDNNEAQPVHEHVSVALVTEGVKQKAAGGKQYAQRSKQKADGAPQEAAVGSPKPGVSGRKASLKTPIATVMPIEPGRSIQAKTP